MTFMRTDPSCSTLSQIRRPEQGHGNWGFFSGLRSLLVLMYVDKLQYIRSHYPGTFGDILAYWNSIVTYNLQSGSAYLCSLSLVSLFVRFFLRFIPILLETVCVNSLYVFYARPTPPTIFHLTQCTLVFELASAPPSA